MRFFSLLFALFSIGWAGTAFSQDGYLVLFSYPHQEMVEVAYRKGDGLKQISHLMRSKDGAEMAIAPELIERIDQIQDHFKADAVEIISGYRSPEYNARLKAEGHSVAKESLHMQGMAADIHLDEISEAALFQYVLRLKNGGAGFYPSLHFVHIDLGKTRRWAEAEGERKLVGLEANQGPCQISTDKNFYFEGKDSKIVLQISGPPDCKKRCPLFLEHFHRGNWERLKEPAEKHSPLLISKKFPAGKYRIILSSKKESPPSLSSEFYLKRE